METEFRAGVEEDPAEARDRRVGLALAVLAVLPALAAVWLVPGFVTQDGPAHVYNAHVLVESLRVDSPFRGAYEVRWRPVPNWAGHMALMGLLAAGVPPRVADRVLMSATLAGFAASVLWLRRRVAGWRGLPTAALLAALLALNVTWLLGFYSFLLGACLFPITLGLWWSGRDRPGPRQAAAVGALLVPGYFSHLVALGLTVAGLLGLAVLTPGPGRARRWGWTLASLGPLVPLAIVYRALMRGGGAVEPLWMELADPASLASWRSRLGWVDPLTLGSKLSAPFAAGPWSGFVALAPVIWFILALVALAVRTACGPGSALRRKQRVWAVLAVVLVIGGMIGPDTLGAKHGNYLSQRVILLGLATAVAALDLRLDRPLDWPATAGLAGALMMQSAFIWDYAARSDRLVGAFLRAGPLVGRGQRVGTLLLDLRNSFRANPLLHADCLLGVGTGNVIWSNYESAEYYFPVQVRGGLTHPPVRAFELISIRDDPAVAPARAAEWSALLAAHHGAIDRLVVWGFDPRMDAITARWFVPEARAGQVRVLHRRPADSLFRQGSLDPRRLQNFNASSAQPESARRRR